MAVKDFTANQIRTAKIIMTGSAPSGGIAHKKLELSIYSESVAPDQLGSNPAAPTYTNVGNDVAIFVSGSQTSRDGANGGAILFQGDTYISGTLVVKDAGRNAGGSISGSIHHTADGNSYMIAGAGITIASGSNGQVTITSTISTDVLEGLHYYDEFNGTPDLDPNASGTHSIAIGDGANAVGLDSLAFGNEVTASSSRDAVVGGYRNKTIEAYAGNQYNSIFGGKDNLISGSESSVIAGGVANHISGSSSTATNPTLFSGIFGGFQNKISGSYSTILGGYQNKIEQNYSTVIGQSLTSSNTGEVVIGFGSTYAGAGLNRTIISGSNFIVAASNASVFNEDGATADFRVEGTSASIPKKGAILVDGGTNQVVIQGGGVNAATAYGLNSATSALPAQISTYISGACGTSGATPAASGVTVIAGDLLISGSLFVKPCYLAEGADLSEFSVPLSTESIPHQGASAYVVAGVGYGINNLPITVVKTYSAGTVVVHKNMAVFEAGIKGASPLSIFASGSTDALIVSGNVEIVAASGSNVGANLTISGSMTVTGSMTVSGSNTFTVYGPSIFNADQNANNDFQVRSSGNANFIFGDASTSRVGVNQPTPAYSLDVVGDAKVSSNLTIGGDLIVKGATTTISSSNLVIQDSIIGLGFSGSSDAGAIFNNTGDRAIIFGRGASTTSALPAINYDGSNSNIEFATFIASPSSGSMGAPQTYLDIVPANIKMPAAGEVSTAAGDLTLEAKAATAKVVIKGDQTSGTSIHIDGNEAAGSIVDIDAGILDIDAAGAITLDGTGISLDSDAASNFTTSVGALSLIASQDHADAKVILSGSSGNDSVHVTSDITIDGKTFITDDVQLDANNRIYFDGNSVTNGPFISGNTTTLHVDGDNFLNFYYDNTTRFYNENNAKTMLLLSSSHVLIMSGGGATSPNEADYTDTNFFVSGSIGSKGTSTLGTAVFGGDVVISGTLHGGSPLDIGSDINLIVDGSKLAFGVNNEITLTHVHDAGLTITNTIAGTDNKPVVLQLKSEEDVIIAEDVIASIEFAAGDSDGTDGADVSAGIHAIAENTFGSNANATKLVFTTAVQESANSAATAKMTLDSGGNLKLAGELQTANIGFTDGDNAIVIANGGGITAAAGITSIAASNLLGATSFNDANITNVGDLNCDSLSVDDAAVGLDIQFGGNTTLNKLTLTDNLADALNITEAGNSYIKFITTDSSEAVVVAKKLEVSSGIIDVTNATENSILIPDNKGDALVIKEGNNLYAKFATTDGFELVTFFKDVLIQDDKKLLFGTNSDAYIEYDEDASDSLVAHVPAAGFSITGIPTADNSPVRLNLLSNEAALIADEVVGQIDFQAIGETGADAIEVCASIQAIAEAEFDISNNKTKLAFFTAKSEDATSVAAKLEINHAGSVKMNAGTTTAGGNGFDGGEDGAPTADVQEINNEVVTTFKINIDDMVSTAGGGARIIGDSADAANAYFARLDSGVNGLIYKAEMICVEAPTAGEPDLDLYAKSDIMPEGAGVGGDFAKLIDADGDWIVSKCKEQCGPFAGSTDPAYTNGLHNYYLYLANGNGGTSDAGTYGAGKWLVRLYGVKTFGT